MKNVDLSKEINNKIKDINNSIIQGKISLLDMELAPIFNQLKNTLTPSNLNNYSKTYSNACELLEQKFEDLKKLLKNLNNESKFFEYLNSNPEDHEIAKLFKGCWIKIFSLNSVSIDYLEDCKEKLCKEREEKTYPSLELKKEITEEEFILEIPMQDFNMQMELYYKQIKAKFPCSLDELFESEEDQSEIFKNFVFLLHLFQLGKVQYQKETNFLYIEEEQK
ncbi:MAG: hypothetical protein ACTSR8_20125 [Promethearchaeota archaeon]